MKTSIDKNSYSKINISEPLITYNLHFMNLDIFALTQTEFKKVASEYLSTQ